MINAFSIYEISSASFANSVPSTSSKYSIAIAISGSRADSLMMYNTAFIVSRDSTDTYNQIRGKNMVAYFVKNELARINVDGNAQTIYFVREEDGFLIGVDIAESSNMVIRIKNSEINSISYMQNVDKDMFPENELTEEQTTLKDFSWQADLRPINKWDIFRTKPLQSSEATSTQD